MSGREGGKRKVGCAEIFFEHAHPPSPCLDWGEGGDGEISCERRRGGEGFVGLAQGDYSPLVRDLFNSTRGASKESDRNVEMPF